MNLLAAELSDEHYRAVSKLVYRTCGINLHEGKQELVKSRLMKRLRALGLDSFESYLKHVESDASGRELVVLLDTLTTNKTSFFREAQHFEFIRQRVLPEFADHSRLRFWSAGCSSGEEPYSLAIVLHEEIPDLERSDVKILATDLSTQVLAMARRAVYPKQVLGSVPVSLRSRYFTHTEDGSDYRVIEAIRTSVRFARLNLMEPWPMKGPFQVILCRNVMIYFDKATRERLVQRFWELLIPGGYLFVGHSESLASTAYRFHYVQPAVYRK